MVYQMAAMPFYESVEIRNRVALSGSAGNHKPKHKAIQYALVLITVGGFHCGRFRARALATKLLHHGFSRDLPKIMGGPSAAVRL